MVFEQNGKLYRRRDKELLCIEPWGENGLRVRATQLMDFLPGEDFALLPKPQGHTGAICIEGDRAAVENGKIRCRMDHNGVLSFYNQRGDLLLMEYDRNHHPVEENAFDSALEIKPRYFEPRLGTDFYRLSVRFEASQGEKLFGMGQYQQPDFDLKGCVLELAHRNSQASVPFLLSNKGYGMLWNNPAIGQVVFGKNRTEWTATSTRQMDYWITAGDTPAEIEESYAGVTGTVPMMPAFATGFWQCKLRYQTQEELLEVAREYKRRGLPLSVIVADFFHWPHQGDWKFDPEYWPDPSAMVQELKDMGVELMVSVWPTADKDSENFAAMEDQGLLTRSEFGTRMVMLADAAIVDMTNQQARDFVWDKLRQNYYSHGIHLFWLDEAEPEFHGYEYSYYRYHRGTDLEIGNLYPREYAKMVYDGLQKEGTTDVLSLLRCAWAGSQRYGALVWSGDIHSSFRSLRNQLSAGLHMGLAGIPWWTTDIGGFNGGDIRTPEFKECLVRWFEYGTFCPVMRLHGNRTPATPPLGDTGGGRMPSGGANEVWSFGDEVYEICKKHLILREKLRPYLNEQMRRAHEKGTPVIRPLFYDFPADAKCWEIADQFLLGPDILVCPVLYENQRERAVYLPAGAAWRSLRDGAVYSGGGVYTMEAPLDSIPVFLRDSALPELTL